MFTAAFARQVLAPAGQDQPGSRQIIPHGGFDKRLHMDSEGAGQVCVMILDGFDRRRLLRQRPCS